MNESFWKGLVALIGLGFVGMTSQAAPALDNNVATTHGSVVLRDGRHLGYTAHAGYLSLVNDATREETAHVYFVSYVADRVAGGSPRPLTFVFPGGPGAPASTSANGPRIVSVKDGEAKVENNPDTMLASTDLVFVDPVGTGYSRVTKSEFTPLFYGIKQDADALAEVVRLYLQRFDPSESQIFFSGGSYGSVRCVLVGEAAMNRGIPIRGIMISAEGMILATLGSDSWYATLVPGFTLVASVYKKLPADLQGDRNKAISEAQAWAYDVYLPAIAKGNNLSGEDRKRIVSQMARLTGLKPEVIEAHNLKISQELFTNELLRDEKKSVGFYDTRISGPAQDGPYDATKDPSLMARGVAYPSLKERALLNRELGMISDNYYAGPFGGGWPAKEGFQDWMAVKWGMTLEQEPVGSGLEILLPSFVRIVDQGVRVFIGQGNYDWACPPFGAEYVAARVSPSHKNDVSIARYESGHGVPPAQFAADVAKFLNKVLKEERPPGPVSMADE